MTEQLHFHFSLSCIGEGNGNPLQCSCLENPRGGRAWWAAVYGVAQTWTRLKRLSSSSSSTVHRPNPTFVSEFQLSGEGGPVHPKGPPLEELLPGEPGPHSCWEAQQYKCSNTHPHTCHGQFWEPRALCPLLLLISGQQLPLPVSSPGRHGVTDSCQRRAQILPS